MKRSDWDKKIGRYCEKGGILKNRYCEKERETIMKKDIIIMETRGGKKFVEPKIKCLYLTLAIFLQNRNNAF